VEGSCGEVKDFLSAGLLFITRDQGIQTLEKGFDFNDDPKKLFVQVYPLSFKLQQASWTSGQLVKGQELTTGLFNHLMK